MGALLDRVWVHLGRVDEISQVGVMQPARGVGVSGEGAVVEGLAVEVLLLGTQGGAVSSHRCLGKLLRDHVQGNSVEFLEIVHKGF